jgi:SAM-dependent methyltransferase
MAEQTPSIESHLPEPEPSPASEFSAWLRQPPGRYLLAWEQAQLDAAVANLFGFHALQLGLPELQGLAANRMPHRWVAGVDLHCHHDALPLPSSSLDLVVLPHALELAQDAHQLLREVERVLRPEGRLIILGLNPMSAWGLRQKFGHGFLPRTGDFLGYWRLRDWLKLLSFEIEAGRFGLYRPPLCSELWLERWRGIEDIGARWWPVLGAAYYLQAVKRVQGMRMVGLARHKRLKGKGAPAVAMNHKHREIDD